MKKNVLHSGILAACGVLVFAAVSFKADAEPAPGDPCPDFVLEDTRGKEHRLSDYSGKIVVLEWTNYDCPFVRKHYDTGNMQAMQQEYTSRGVVWLSVCSSAPGKQGNFSAEVVSRRMEEQGATPTAYLFDPLGRAGRAFGAKTTPHLFVVDASGKLAYRGAVDDRPGFRKEEVGEATNYLKMALEALLAGKPVEVGESAPYGCSVKY